jgi:hypothetical protein
MECVVRFGRQCVRVMLQCFGVCALLQRPAARHTVSWERRAKRKGKRIGERERASCFDTVLVGRGAVRRCCSSGLQPDTL